MVSIEIAMLLVLMLSLVEGTEVINAVEVNTPSGWVRGYEENYENGQVYRFVKIPFAQPPIGKRRFQKPQPIGEWEGVQGISDTYSPSCPQWDFPMPGVENLENDENCLYLNIYVPGKISRERNLSVMVWIYGGAFMFGGASQYKPQKLVLGGDVIVVTINYRLALLGFFTLNDPLLSGNFGLWDQIEAFRWVQKNIEAFGGNPNSVTIFGESAGGMSVSLQTLIPSNKGLFQRAISQSGVATFFAISKKDSEKKTADMLLEKTSCNDKEDVSEILKCLQKIPVENITNAITMMDLQTPIYMSTELGGFVPNVDGELIKENLAYPGSSDNDIYSFFRTVDFMSGTLNGEGNVVYGSMTPQLQERFEFNVTEKIPKTVLCEMTAPVFVETAVGNSPNLVQEICDLYTDTESDDAQSNKVCEFTGDSSFIVPSNIMLTIHAEDNTGAKTFQYMVTKASPMPFGGDPPAWFKGAGHSDELYLLFDYLRKIPEEKRKKFADLNLLSENVVQYWANFAKFGNPNSDKLPEWPSYDVNSKRYVILDTQITTGQNLKPEATILLRKIIEKGRQRLAHDEL
ncbi:carboxylesterase 1C-like [Ostrea edulis]|uniref:carboxylesterase 1C-like n=1 Tax=Ostrea edulis TaxID=37623 RepID=UPI0024AEDF15|nr:carboxylesterase 1C-like [Ostrea edulis]